MSYELSFLSHQCHMQSHFSKCLSLLLKNLSVDDTFFHMLISFFLHNTFPQDMPNSLLGDNEARFLETSREHFFLVAWAHFLWISTLLQGSEIISLGDSSNTRLVDNLCTLLVDIWSTLSQVSIVTLVSGSHPTFIS